MRSDYFHLRHDEVGEIDQPSFCLIFISDQDGFGTRCSNRPMRKVGGKLAWSGHSGLVVVVSCPSIHQVDTRGPPRFSTRHPLVDWTGRCDGHRRSVSTSTLLLQMVGGKCPAWEFQISNCIPPHHGLATMWAKYQLLKLTTGTYSLNNSQHPSSLLLKLCVLFMH